MPNNIPIFDEVPSSEKEKFTDLIKSTRKEKIRSSNTIVDSIFKNNPNYKKEITNKNVSNIIKRLRENAWEEFLKDEILFNTSIMKNLNKSFDTPKIILNKLIEKEIDYKNKTELIESVKNICGEYTGRLFPYIYQLCLSNTQSRRSRAGQTFESIIYNIYEILKYNYDSQKKIGRKIFDDNGLGKKVDSVLPSVDSFNKMRSKTIIGTMKTSLRERWQEVAEEIERTKIPVIHLLTVDEKISKNKSKEMAKHNITVVCYKWTANSKELQSQNNMISYETYLFNEIPDINKYWQDGR